MGALPSRAYGPWSPSGGGGAGVLVGAGLGSVFFQCLMVITCPKAKSIHACKRALVVLPSVSSNKTERDEVVPLL